jgi:hypothetical protein
MAVYHLSATPIQRSKGHSAIAAAAYRAGERLYDERLDQVQDYSRKHGVVRSEIFAPENAPDWTRNRQELWNKAEIAERQWNGQPAREIRLALPNELTDGQRADLVFDYVNDVFVSRGMIADVSIHLPDRHGDNRNHHAHILLTMRELDGDVFATRKQREWNRPELLENWREQWAEYQNDALTEAGFDARVDHRSYEDQGIDREPTRHIGKNASAMERDGIATDIGDRNREIAERNAELERLRATLEETLKEQATIEAEIAWEQVSDLEEPEPSVVYFDNNEVHTVQPEPPLSWEEQKRQAVSAFTDTWTLAWLGTSAPPSDVLQEPEPEIDPVLASHKRDILEYGQVQETGLGRNWYDRTITMFENMYYSMVEQVRDFRERYFASQEPERDKDEPEMEIW